ncbi:MAG: DNA translocase FtsK [Cyclobacteriaceae bacterium]
MAENTYRTNTYREPEKEKEKDKEKRKKKSKSGFTPAFFKDPRFELATGFFLLVLSLFLTVALISYLFTGKNDHSLLTGSANVPLIKSGIETSNWAGLWGAFAAYYLIYKWLGIAALFIPPILFNLGFKKVFKRMLFPEMPLFYFSLFAGIWIVLLLGYITHSISGYTEIGLFTGGLGFEMARLADSQLGFGTFLLLGLSLIIFIIYFFNITAISLFMPKPEQEVISRPGTEPAGTYTDERDIWIKAPATTPEELPEQIEELKQETVTQEITEPPAVEKNTSPAKEPVFIIEETKTEEEILAGELVDRQGEYDPTLDLSSFKFPPLEILNEYEQGKVQVTQEELNQNKDRISSTLNNFKIGIQSIKATIGPTVTLYEIVPEAGIKISRIKNLEDDIALSLAALGIRIIAPIPGKGTIGIEVPNKNREMVSIRSVLSTVTFQKSDKELPVALGKTISNEVLVIDLAKMPHLLVAGATGQGKSVGLNVILTSLLYKRHPSQLKFVLVDPKKVEMSLFSKIERHYLAKLPNSEEAIITDTRKVVHTLNSLCIEMENRYEILKEAGAKNLKEYNAKFVARKLNPKEGHRFLPYIVLVIDELADLMMTAGKEVETPIARLAQLARAIGIHLVVATQRPSVNVITGVIKANFPARLSFRVTSKVDSRTILDTGGADQLIGMGDMLLSGGSDIIRLQCPFVDTPEVERVCEYIGSQRGYDSAYLLPEYEDEESGADSVDLSDRDSMFEEAARLIVSHQQGSTSLIQRKLKLGYNRAGRLIDQLEAAGIVGGFEGSKAREVLIKDEMALDQLLTSLKEKHGGN